MRPPEEKICPVTGASRTKHLLLVYVETCSLLEEADNGFKVALRRSP
jgi:hypothetical protein